MAKKWGRKKRWNKLYPWSLSRVLGLLKTDYTSFKVADGGGSFENFNVSDGEGGNEDFNVVE